MPDEIYTPDNLLAGSEFPAVTKAYTLLSGENRKRGTVLGAVSVVLGAVAAAANTGNGTCTLAALKKSTKVGDYIVTCVATAVNGGIFSVVNPEGRRLKDAVMGAYATDEIGFTLTDGATDFAVGDSFTIPVTAGSGKLKMVDKSAVDGSQNAKTVLAFDCDASLADAKCAGYETGIFNKNAVILAEGTVAADVEDALRARGIFLRDMRTL